MKTLHAEHFLLDVRLLRDRVPSFDAYPFCVPAVRALDALALHPRVTFLVGENGTGKSTLLEAVAVNLGLNAEGGGRNFRFATRPSHSELHEYLLLRTGIRRRPRDRFFFRAESFFNLATEVERLGVGDAYGGRPLHERSHGESFLALFQNRFFDQGLYLMDEPEAALSPTRQMAFLSALHDMVLAGSQFVIATHSPIVMAYPDAWIYRLDAGGGIVRVQYQQTEHYKVTSAFLARTDQMLSVLLDRRDPPA